ncbi:MAG TPA: hypothetical protein DHV24_12625, partial [Candidatus Margulisbacteria bacterium]|nr:hypothetical protein [Candidatus Margulisiibacteriota bacterium]
MSDGSIKAGSSVKLIFNYDLPSLSEEQINAYYWNGMKWICLGGQVVAGRLEVNATHFTKFSVMADTSLPVLSDIRSHWAYSDIKRLVGMKVISGYPDRTFKPENNVTRAEFAVLMAKALGWEAGDRAPDFTDEAEIPAWARGYVAAAVEKGVINGYEDRTFRAGQQINRSEIAVMLMRALGKQGEAAEAK